MSVRHSFPAALAAAALVGGLLSAAPASAAASTPPFENGSNSAEVGTITFYDANGNVITSGSSANAPFAAYAVGSNTPRTSDTQAQLLFANPDPNSQPALWFKSGVGLYNSYPLTSGPSSVQTLSTTHPVVVGDAGDNTPDHFESTAQASTQSGYAHIVQVRLRTANSSNQPSPSYDVADIQVDPTSHTWTQIYPAVSGPASTVTTMTASPNPATAGTSVSLSASESPAVAGSMQFRDGSNPIGSPVAVDASGAAMTTTSSLAVGNHPLSAVFTPTDTADYSSSTGTTTEVINAAAPASPDGTSLTIAATRSIDYGRTGAVSTVLRDTTDGAALGGQTVTLQERSATSSTFRTAATARTTTDGSATIAVRPASDTVYRWVFDGSASLSSSVSTSAQTDVIPGLTAAVSHSKIKHGQSVAVYGAMTPNIVGTRVYLQERVGRTWKTVRGTAVIKRQKLPNGHTGYDYVLVIKLVKKGVYALRAYIPASRSLSGTISAARTVRAS